MDHIYQKGHQINCNMKSLDLRQITYEEKELWTSATVVRIHKESNQLFIGPYSN